MVWSALWGYAEILVITPRHNISHWEKTGSIDNPQAAKESWGRLQKAIILNSSNAEFYMDLARLATLLANAAKLASPDKNQFQDQAINNLKLTLSKRPTWGLAWAKLAQAYANDSKHTSDFIQALERAIYFEPYSELSQQHIIPLGIAHWGMLPDSLKKDLRGMVKDALRYHSELAISIIKTAVAYDWTVELTLLIENKAQKQLIEKEIIEKSTFNE